jgi:hypothetical protein
VRRKPPRSGLSAVEVIVLVLLVGTVGLYLLIALPRGREKSREVTCKRNLMQIGQALAIYHESAGHLPTARLGEESPLAVMLGELGRPDFVGLDKSKTEPRHRLGPPVERPVPGFVCPSDPNATAGIHPAPISYRANTGDTSDGKNGPFWLGRRVTLEEVAAADGEAFTAAFTERLVGNNRPGDPGTADYALVPGPIGGPPCPRVDPTSLRADAGSSWLKADWRSTLYNHATTPEFSPGCVASDGQSALMGASSGHEAGVHVLLLDGSVRTYSRTVPPEIWRPLGTIGERTE